MDKLEPGSLTVAETALVTSAFSGADDGIRTRDPHLGKKKVADPSSLTCGVAPIQPVSCVFSFACNWVVSRCCGLVHGTPTGPRDADRA
jgi:hypothetical protein